MTKDISDEMDAFIESLLKEHVAEELLPDDMTAAKLQKRTDFTISWCRELLDRQVRAGKMICVKVRSESGQIINAYRLVK